MQMIALPYLTAIRFSGADAGDFLHNQLSADVLALSGGESTFACYCEPRGRVLALMLVCRLDDGYCVIMSTALASLIADRLKIYVMRSKVTIELLSVDTVVGLQADGRPEITANSIPAIPLPHSNKWFAVVSDENLPDKNAPAQDTWKVWELQQGITWLSRKSSGEFLPQMLGFDQLGAVNFRKGCYPGQEIVARTHYLGKVKRHPRVLETSAIICPAPLEQLKILSDEQSYEAVIADCGHFENGSSCLFAITRMEPDLAADNIEYHGQIAPLI